MRTRLFATALVAFAALTAGLSVPAATAATPVCQKVQIQENSGNGPSYPVNLCGSKALPIRSMIVDGAALPERTTTHSRVVFWSGGTPALATLTASPSHTAACFGNLGIQFASKDAYLCEVKLGGDPSGSLYFSPSLDSGLNGPPCNNPPNCPQMVWYKLHPASGNFYVWENFSPSWDAGAPRSNGRIIGIDEGRFGQCIVSWPSWTVNPTGVRCFSLGGEGLSPLRPLTPAEQNSIAEYQKNMRADVPLEYR